MRFAYADPPYHQGVLDGHPLTAALEAAAFRPGVLIVAVAFALVAIFGGRISRWVRRRWLTAHPTIDQASHDRGPMPGQEET